MSFSSDNFFWYNVPGWSELGLAVPNWGKMERTQNGEIRYLTEVVGRNLQAIMFHPDTRLTSPPTLNTLTRIHKLCTRFREIITARMVKEGVGELYAPESSHAMPAAEEFVVFPTPFFTVRNRWLKEYSQLILLCLTECMQDQENARPMQISQAFASRVSPFIQRVYKLMATELLKVPEADAEKPDFTLSSAQLAAYAPSQWFTSTELIDVGAKPEEVSTEEDRTVLQAGIAVSMLPKLPFWPASYNVQGTGIANSQPASSAFPGPASP